MKFFWQKSQQSEPQAEAQSETSTAVDVEAIARAVATEAAHEAAHSAALEVTRAFASSTLAQQQEALQTNPQTSPFPLYAYDTPITFSTPISPRTRPGSIVSVDTLRQVAETYDVLRACIQHLKREVSAVPIEIVPKDDTDNSPKTRRQIREATDFLSVPGGLGGVGQRRQHFERQIIEDVLIVGAAATFYSPTMGAGVYEVLPIDAATIRPRVDGFGWPGPGEEAFEQWVQGVKVAGFTRKQMRYDGLQPISYSPYFKSPIEWVLAPINAALRADAWNLAWLTDGNSANKTFALPPEWGPEQIKSWFAMWEAQCAGNSKNRQKTRFVPGGTQKVGEESRKDADFQQFEWWLARRVFAVMGVQPASVGYVGEQYKVSQDASMDSTSLFSGGELLDFRKATYDDLWDRMGLDRIETRNQISKEEDSKKQAERHEIEIRSGKRSINECRQESGEEPVHGGDQHFVSNTLVSLDSAGVTPATPSAVGTTPGNDSASVDDQASTDDANTNDSANNGDGQNSAEALRFELSQWERKAIKRLKEKGSAACSFESRFISREIRSEIAQRLQHLGNAADRDAVRAVFRSTKNLEEVADVIQSLDGAISASEAANLLGLLQRAQTMRLNRVLGDVVSDDISVSAAESQLYDALATAHANAAHLGRKLAGEDSEFGKADSALGARVADEQIQYAEKFAADIESGRYDTDDGGTDTAAIERRSALYEKRLRGTANESWANAQSELITWELGSAQHCGTCEDIANNSPYRPEDLPTYPGAGETECNVGCDCTLRSESGATGF